MLDESKLKELAGDIARELVVQKGVHFSYLGKKCDGIVIPEKKQIRVIAQVEDVDDNIQ